MASTIVLKYAAARETYQTSLAIGREVNVVPLNTLDTCCVRRETRAIGIMADILMGAIGSFCMLKIYWPSADVVIIELLTTETCRLVPLTDDVQAIDVAACWLGCQPSPNNKTPLVSLHSGNDPVEDKS